MWLRKGQVARFCEHDTVEKYKNNQQMYCGIYAVFYSQCSHQHASVGIPAIFKVFDMFDRASFM